MAEDFFEIPVALRFTNPVAADSRTGPWSSVAEACAMVPIEVRIPGLMVTIRPAGGKAVKYWWPGPGLGNTELIPYLPTTPPTSGGSGGQRGRYFSLPGVYSADNRLHDLAPGTVDVDLFFGSGRILRPLVDYTLDKTAVPPRLSITAELPTYEGEEIWGYPYSVSVRRYYALPGVYGPGYAPVIMAAGTTDVDVIFGSGRQLRPNIDYTFDVATLTLTLLVDADIYEGEELWLWIWGTQEAPTGGGGGGGTPPDPEPVNNQVTTWPYRNGNANITGNTVAQTVAGGEPAQAASNAKLAVGATGAVTAVSSGGWLGFDDTADYLPGVGNFNFAIRLDPGNGKIICVASNSYFSDEVTGRPNTTQLRLRADASTIYFEYSLNDGAAWSIIQQKPRGEEDMWVKAWTDTGDIHAITHTNLYTS
ncbi:hypothetical protein [Hymenobacter fodinae]|uniref:Uncharacterized protein n=1 Tax=Hymenobacter fodinae TaxID=2510796 RepID=A0A4Z0P9U6_9BACT|nr:hypothetical protein [Hymenobacter fodinae]TGE08745.1 hypothetical protein EU556_13750 [Hymenobacter fodinae]